VRNNIIKLGSEHGHMEIEVMEQDSDSLSGQPEAWVRVRSDEVLDWDDVRNKLTYQQLRTLDRYMQKVHKYFPGERWDETSTYRFEDFWVFKIDPFASARKSL
jgi:hypothetical protein